MCVCLINLNHQLLVEETESSSRLEFSIYLGLSIFYLLTAGITDGAAALGVLFSYSLASLSSVMWSSIRLTNAMTLAIA